jgi:glutaminase
VLAQHRGDADGALADYIPELASVDPDRFGAALVSVHGRLYTAGDASTPFTIQSISKPFVYALALAEHGLEGVARHVGFEPSGEPFNAISLDPESGRPENPMINAGAIVTSALVSGSGPDERFERIRAFLSVCAGRELDVDEDVWHSESVTGHRNRALANLALAAGVMTRSVDDACEVYFRQCAIRVTATDLAIMAGTLADGGVNPCTGVAVLDEEITRHVLSIMLSCGMYDESGEWAVRVGLPAKSGVGGGIAAVRPGQFGIGIYSPRLDEKGNSVRGVAALRSLAADYDIHLLSQPRVPRSPIVHSSVEGDRWTVVLRGEIDFISAEEIIAHIVGHHDDPDRRDAELWLDTAGVTRVWPEALRALTAVVARLRESGRTVAITDPSGTFGRDR